MEKIISAIGKLNIEIILVIGIIIFCFLTGYKIGYNEKFILQDRESVSITFLGISIFLFLALIIYVLLKHFSTIGYSKLLSKKDGSLVLTVGNSIITTSFGKIETYNNCKQGSMIVLPANEYFDDDCINDKKSALGAYINSISNNVSSVIQEITEITNSYEGTEIEKENGSFQKSFGVSQVVYLKETIERTVPVLLTSVTTKRANEGLRSEVKYIFNAIDKVICTAADKRKRKLIIPVMGAGHGGVKHEIAYSAILMAILGSINRPNGHHVKEFEIVIFKNDEKSEPSIKKSKVRQILAFAGNNFKQ